MSIKNKVAIVTGASFGIGLATAKLFAKRGAKVALTARSKDRLKKLEAELPHSLAVPTDMTKAAAIKKMVSVVLKHFGQIDILINNAGQGYDALVENIELDKFRYIIDLDLIGPLVAMQAVIPIMRRQGGGTIVNISSGTTYIYLPTMSPYSSIKTALNAITLIGRKELASDKIVMSVVYPYITATDFEKNTLRSGKTFFPQEGSRNLPPADLPKTVAEKILEVVLSGKAEQFVHNWMDSLT